MLSSAVLGNRQNLLGQRVCLEGNKLGIIQFYGETSFADGLWCGIELDEAIGENNGMIDNIGYFTCKENCGIFVPASEIKISNLLSDNYSDISSSPKPVTLIDNEVYNLNLKNLFCKFPVSEDSDPDSVKVLSERSALNESYTISKECYLEEKLSIITEENSESSNYLDTTNLKYFTNVTDLSKCETTFSVDQNTKLTSLALTDPKKEILDQDFETNYDSDESLGLLPGLLEDSTWDNLIYDKDELDRDPTILMNLPDKYMETFSKHHNLEPKPNVEELIISPICNKPNISFGSKSNESPVSCNQSVPMCASTPKYESNYSYVIEEVALTQNIADNFHLNKETSVSEKEKNLEVVLNETNIEMSLDPVMTNVPTSTHSNSDENSDSGQNVLNVTCNIGKSLNNEESSLNKTFESVNIFTDKYTLPTILSHTETNLINKLDIPDHSIQILKPEFSHFLPHIQYEQCDAAPVDTNLCEENALNLTCDLTSKFNAHLPQVEFMKDITFSDNLKGSATNLSYPRELGKTQQIYFINDNESEKEINTADGKTGDILDSTYEKNDESYRLDTSTETLKCITNLKENKKSMQFGTRNKNTSSFDKVKSMKSFGGTNITNTKVKKPTARNSFASNIYSSSEVHEEKIINPSSVKGLLLKSSIKDSESKSSLIKKERFADMNDSGLIKNAIKRSPLKLSEDKHEETKSVSKIKFKKSQEFLLNKTINLPPPISDLGKTVVKKPRQSMQFSHSKKRPLGLDKVPLNISTKSAIPFLQKTASIRISTTKKEITRESKKDESFALSSERSLKKPVALEERKNISRLPHKTSSLKNVLNDGMPEHIKSTSNIAKPQFIISALKPPSIRGSIRSSTSRKSLVQKSELPSKNTLNDSILISSAQSNKDQSIKNLKSRTSSSKNSSIPQLSQKQEKI